MLEKEKNKEQIKKDKKKEREKRITKAQLKFYFCPFNFSFYFN